jgi:hypothetical protein
MPDRFDELEARVDKLIRYIELIDNSLRDLKEQIEIRHELDKVENIVLRLARSLKSRKTK